MDSLDRPEAQPSLSDTEELLPLIYDELRRVAQQKMNDEGGPQTLSATALVHEAYLRISKRSEKPHWESPRQLFVAAAEAMRRILIDRARAKKGLKRGGNLERIELVESLVMTSNKDDELLAIDEALEVLEAEDPESAELVKLRYFAGLTWEEISEATGVPDRTIRRRWTYAKVWLQERVERERE